MGGLLSMTDCTVEDNRVQARHELDAAELMIGEDWENAMLGWVQKWGRELLDAGVITDDDVQDAIQRAENEATELESKNDTLTETIEAAIKALDALDFGALYREKIDAIIGNLERPL